MTHNAADHQSAMGALLATDDLTASKARELFRYDPETGILYRRHATCEKVGRAKSNGYLVVHAYGKNRQAHRVIWLMVHGKWPEGEIDHINGVRTDNRLENLRDVSHTLNSRNRPDAKRNPVIGPVPKDGEWFVVLPHYEDYTMEGPFNNHADAHDFFAKHIAKRAKTEGNPRPKLQPC